MKGQTSPSRGAQDVAPKQVRLLRAALGDQSELISHADQQLLGLEHQMAMIEETQRAF